MRRSSGRGATEPLAATVAVALVCTGLSIYAGAVDDRTPPPRDERLRAEQLLDRVADRLGEDGVVDPSGLDRSVLDGAIRANVTVTSEAVERQAGPTPPPGATAASRRLSVRLGPGEISPGRLRVVVW